MLFARFERSLRDKGFLAMGGQIVDATRSRVRAKVERVFAAEKCRFKLVIRTIGLDRATAKIALVNLAYNFTRLAWLERRPASA